MSVDGKGPQPHDSKSIRILNRVTTWSNEGITYEADQRHAEILIYDMGLSNESKSVGTPGIKPISEEQCNWDVEADSGDCCQGFGAGPI